MPDTATTRYSVVIPARYGSTRLPGKALADIGGRPLIEWVWRSAVRSRADEVVIATDDSRIQSACAGFGADVCMTRSDHASGTERVAEVVRQRDWPSDHIVVNLQGDEPDTAAENLDAVAQCLAASPLAVMSTLSVPLDDAEWYHDPNCVKVVADTSGYALYFSRAPIPGQPGAAAGAVPNGAARHLGIYAFRAAFLARFSELSVSPLEQVESLEQLRVLWHGERIAVATAPRVPGPGVDTPRDLERARRVLAPPADE
ncbi:MAG: 3-deoxy-manno-octulosonate cytidylyltransferase [Pseudomonadota bacterium]